MCIAIGVSIMYDHIVLPTDGSPEMDAVVDHAGELARAHNATIHVLYVVDSGAFTGLPAETSFDRLERMLKEDGERALSATVEQLGPDVTVEQELLEGSPAAEIVDFAGDHGDVVVMGTHGRGGLNRLLLGSVAERVVRRCPRPVLTVRVSEPEE
jgi:nucleotide-binding universal stress UspA family protein